MKYLSSLVDPVSPFVVSVPLCLVVTQNSCQEQERKEKGGRAVAVTWCGQENIG